MTDQENVEPEGKESKPFFEAARKVLLAGIGAMALAQEEVEEFVVRLVERGEIAEKDGRKLVHEIMEKRKKASEKTEDHLRKRIETVLDRMDIARKSDIEALNEKIAGLSNKLDKLTKP